MSATAEVAGLLFGLTAMLLTWAGIEIAASALARYRTAFTDEAKFRLGELFLFVDPARLFALTLGAVVMLAIALSLATGHLLVGLAIAATLTLLPRPLFRWLRKRRIEIIERQLPDALQLIAGGLRAGVSLNLALQQLVREGRAPLSQEVDLLLREHRLGIPMDQALEHLARRIPLQAITLVVAAMRIANETGGNLAEALERASITVRSQLAMEDKIRALTAQGKLQAFVVGLLPVALLLVLSHMEADAMAVMWGTQTGWATLAAIALLEFFGILLIRRIVAIDV